MDLNSREGVVAYMKESTSLKDWNARCLAVQAANGNDYPYYWYVEIVLSGVAYEAEANW